MDRLAHDISKYKIEKQDTCNKKSEIIMKLMKSATPSQQIKSSYMRNSSIKRSKQPSTPLIS